MIGVFTHAFDFYYKAVPTGSNQLLTSTWYNDSYGDLYENNTEYSRRWFNYNGSTGFLTYPSILTRNTPQLSSSVYQNGALAWGSAANDFLWNVLTPSMSVSQQVDGAGRHLTAYKFTYNSESFFNKEFQTYGTGVATYPITSSWIAYEPRMVNVASGSTSTGYVTNGGTSDYFPAIIQSPGLYSLPTAQVAPAFDPFVGENPTNLTYGSNSTGSNDGRFFDLAGGCGITRTSISASLALYETNKTGITNTSRQLVATSLKRRRLFFPTIRTGSMNFAPGSPGIWVQTLMGIPSNNIFTENGGIYNVRFNIKRDITNGYTPDIGSELLVYIHNVNANAPAPVDRVPGADGWYPPEANIVRIKNTADSPMQFDNPGNQYKIESFNINVVQYGTPAQLVFEASGSLDSNNFFGCIIDDVQFCKIGVTTDPNLIKPTTVGGTATANYLREEGFGF
jgi:hypothetical protein